MSDVDEGCQFDTRLRRSRALQWCLGRAYVFGVVRGFGVHGCDGESGEMHVCGSMFRWCWPGQGPYTLGWPRQKWRCVLQRHHWPYWPDGRPLWMGLCGRCLRCEACGSIERVCACERAEALAEFPR